MAANHFVAIAASSPCCRRLASLGATAASEGWGVAPFEEHRDTHLFSRRVGHLPEAKEDEKVGTLCTLCVIWVLSVLC